jgi:hypothetical protein
MHRAKARLLELRLQKPFCAWLSSVHIGVNAARGECFVTHWANGWRTGATFCGGARHRVGFYFKRAASS